MSIHTDSSPTVHGTAQIQGQLWGARATDYAELVEPLARPIYERVFEEAGVGMGTRYLDIGCGPGLAAQIAAANGAQAAGLDAAAPSIDIARQRTPDGDFRVGELEALPWDDDTFDVVTSFNAFQYAADPVHALREARRVAKPQGKVAIVVWGRDEDCESSVSIAAVSKLLPPQPPGAGRSALSAPGRVEALLEEAGITPLTSGEVDCIFEFSDLETAVRGMTSAGVMVAIAQKVGDDVLRQAVADSLASFRTPTGGTRQRNRFRYVIGSA